MRYWNSAALLVFMHFWTFSQSYHQSGELLWEIDYGNHKSYLWGSLHTNEKELFEFPDSVYWAFDKCQLVAVEIDVFNYFLEKEPVLDAPKILFDKQGKMYTSSDEPTQTHYGTEDGMPQFMDAFFQEEAERQKKKVVPLESPNLQTRALVAAPLIEQELYNASAEKVLLKSYYLQGRLSSIDRLLRAKFSQQKQAYIDLVEKRNQYLTDNLYKEITSNSVFCSIGAVHLYGDKGVLNLLRAKGCKVRKIELNTSSPKQYKGFPTSRKFEFVFAFEGSVIKANLPGVPRSIPSGVVFKELGQGNTYKIQWQPKDTILTLLDYAEILMAPPKNSYYSIGVLDDGTEYVQGLSDAYPEPLTWKRILMNEHHIAILTCHGGNKLMNSDRPNRFFNNVVLE
jgi:uncharacterized protein YbaP (TraB family)